MNTDYVNKEFRQRRRASSLGDLTDSSIFESTALSYPTNPELSKLDLTFDQKIDDLEKQLLSANNEIDNLLQENRRIGSELEKSRKLIDMYKKIEFNDVQNTPYQGRKRKRIRMSIGLEGTPSSSALTSIERHNFIFERQQETIKDLNLQIKTLEQWQEEEKKKNSTVDKYKRDTKSYKVCKKNIAKTTHKTRFAILRKFKTLSKKISKLEKQCERARQENEQLQHTITEFKALHRLEEENKAYSHRTKNNDTICYSRNIPETDEVDRKIKKTVIFSDTIGQGLASTLLNHIDKTNKIINYCKPGATYDKILDNFSKKTKDLDEHDIVVILINNYNVSLNHKTKSTYVNTIREMVNKPDRLFNIIICGLRYDNVNDANIFDINYEIATLAGLVENVKYVESNIQSKRGKLCSYSSLKNFIKQSIILLISAKTFTGSTRLTFVKCFSDSKDDVGQSTVINFQKNIQNVKNR